MATKRRATKRGRGRPRRFEPGERTIVSLVLRRDQVVALDRLSTDLLEESGAVVSRSDLARAFDDAILAGRIAFRGATTEEEIRALIAARLRGKR